MSLEKILRCRVSVEDYKAFHAYAKRHGVTVSSLFRDYMWQRLEADADDGRQGRMAGANIIPLADARGRACIGRESEPEHQCHNKAFDDYDKCKGCHIADSRNWQRAKPKRKAARGRTRTLADL